MVTRDVGWHPRDSFSALLPQMIAARHSTCLLCYSSGGHLSGKVLLSEGERASRAMLPRDALGDRLSDSCLF